MINKHCDLIYYNSLKQSKANAKLYRLTNNYFKFLFQFQKYFLDYIQNSFNSLITTGFSPLCAFANRTQGVETTLLSKFFTFDNLSRSNPCFVINNFNLIKEDIRMRISKTKKFLTIILSISLLFAISCGDRPTGSTTGGGTIPSEHNGKTYKQDTTSSENIFWLQIKDGEIYREYGKNDSKPTEFTTKIRDMIPNVEITIEGNTCIYDWGTSTITFKFADDWNSVEMTDAGAGSSSTTKFIIQ